MSSTSDLRLMETEKQEELRTHEINWVRASQVIARQASSRSLRQSSDSTSSARWSWTNLRTSFAQSITGQSNAYPAKFDVYASFSD